MLNRSRQVTVWESERVSICVAMALRSGLAGLHIDTQAGLLADHCGSWPQADSMSRRAHTHTQTERQWQRPSCLDTLTLSVSASLSSSSPSGLSRCVSLQTNVSSSTGQWLILVCLAKCLQDVCLGYLFPPLSSLPSSSPSPCHKPLSWGEETHHHLGTSRLPELTGNPLLLTAATFSHVSHSRFLPLSFSPSLLPFKIQMFKLEWPIPALRCVCIVTHCCPQSWLAYHSVRRKRYRVSSTSSSSQSKLYCSIISHSSCIHCHGVVFTSFVVHLKIPPNSATKLTAVCQTHCYSVITLK